MTVQISNDEFIEIVKYCAEEVTRQGDTPKHVSYMTNAWVTAIELQHDGKEISLGMVQVWGKMIEPIENYFGFRELDVMIGGRRGPSFTELPSLLDRWIDNVPNMTAIEAYKEFEFIHPFADGNGRTGKVILNYLNGSLLAPIFPPDDLFGYRISNP